MKYAHTFAIANAHCTTCNKVTIQSFAMVATNKAFNNAKRVKTCDVCLNTVETNEMIGGKE